MSVQSGASPYAIFVEYGEVYHEEHKKDNYSKLGKNCR